MAECSPRTNCHPFCCDTTVIFFIPLSLPTQVLPSILQKHCCILPDTNTGKSRCPSQTHSEQRQIGAWDRGRCTVCQPASQQGVRGVHICLHGPWSITGFYLTDVDILSDLLFLSHLSWEWKYMLMGVVSATAEGVCLFETATGI